MTVPDLPISAGEFTELANVATVFMQGTAIILRESLTSDGLGGNTQTFNAVGTVSARLGKLAADEFGSQQLLVGGEISEIASRIMTLPAYTDVALTDRISYSGATYEVVDVIKRDPDEIVRRVRVRQKSS